MITNLLRGAQWLSGRVLDSRPKGRGFEPHRRHCIVSLSKNINPSLVLVQPRKTRPFITERLLKGRKESNQTNKPTFLAQSAHTISNKTVYKFLYTHLIYASIYTYKLFFFLSFLFSLSLSSRSFCQILLCNLKLTDFLLSLLWSARNRDMFNLYYSPYGHPQPLMHLWILPSGLIQ